MKTMRHECKAVVVGTGAGGAVAGAILAEAGVDTIILEQGKYYKSEDHKETSVFSSLTKLYHSAGATVTMGRPPISLTLGRCVGGTTAINSSTCFRPPREKVDSWGGPSWDELVPFFEEVERRINVVEVDIDILGGNWRVLKRGCDALGIDVRPLRHNVLDCKKRGRCQFGCPEGAKQSTEVTFIPAAVEAGATLLAEHKVDEIIVEGGRAVGLRGKCPEGKFEVRAEAVVLSMGAIIGPAFLLRNKLCNSSRRVGEGLQIHPAVRVVAEMDEIVDGHIGLPQGLFIDKWAKRGIMIEGIFIPPGIMIAFLPGAGHELKELAAGYRRLSAFGAMVTDTSAGRVRPGLLGSPFQAFYQINQADSENLRFGIARICEIYLAAGAKRVFTSFFKAPVVYGKDDLSRLESVAMKPTDLELGAFHPLGTCAMGANPGKSVVDFSLETHDVKNLYLMDGSVIPGSLGVNPQITIMGLAMRGAKLLAEKLCN